MRPAAILALSVLLGFAPAGADGVHLLVISGLGGEESYSNDFHEWSLGLISSALEAGVPAENLIYLAEDPARAPERIAGESRKEAIASAIATLGGRAGKDGELWIVIFGHGSARGAETTVNLPGPDLSGSELAALLDRVSAHRIVVVNASSASGDFVRLLSGPGRAIVTATRSASERHAPLFGRFFSESFAGGRADVDKDQRVSLLEAFEYARAEVERTFTGDHRMATEHALLDDNGDRTGSLQPAATGEGDGALASRLFLGGVAVPAAGDSPELARLLERKDELESRVSELRGRRGAIEQDLYLEELETLLLELARTNEEIDRLETSAPESG